MIGAGSCVDFLDGWLNLAEKLLNTQSIVDSPHNIVNPSTSAAANQQVTFDAITFVMKAQQVCITSVCSCTVCMCVLTHVCVYLITVCPMCLQKLITLKR